MAFDEGLAQRVRDAMGNARDVSERKMFGGLCIMIGGNMVVGVNEDNLMVRVGPDAYQEALAQPYAREMDFTGKPLKGYVYVDAAGIAEDAELEAWVTRAVRFVKTLPKKTPKPKKR